MTKKLPEWLRIYLAKEESAIEFRTHSPFVISGLLQTPKYAAAIARSVGVIPPDNEYIERTVELRRSRQQRVLNGDLPIVAIQTEASLRLQLDSPGVMAEQMRTLFRFSQMSNVAIHIMPYRVGQYEALRVGSFTLLRNRDYRDVTVHIEGYDGGQIVEGPDETARLVDAFEHARKLALPVGESQDFMEQVRREWEASNV